MRKVLSYVIPALWPLILALNSFAQQPDFSSFERRLTDLERRVEGLERITPRSPAAATTRRTYADAYRQALAGDTPLVVWSGAAVCPPCVAATEGEFVNYVGTMPDCPAADAITVYVPEGGQLRRAATIGRWVTGDATNGHLPSIRRALARWRESRFVTDVPAAAYQPAVMATGYGMMQSAMMMSGGGGACASCGTAGRGFFGRR